ncbi:MAG: TetR/AcrR family transcriptional regulator [Actinobacteria bacterium]|nr:TetR/AcrR family transcriptional regulator [Actinomycetota bacterium]MBU1944427.1 TetR/AcrR family transcriptional regulator [Actinomycetota bacterium]MBU2688213.1 TetR/AcrR family transcriptional regulator [Actinomycetota bacterium]
MNGEEKRERILEAAVKLFGEKGYNATRMAEVAAAARVSPSTLYKMFDGKKGLFIATRQWVTNRVLRRLIEALPDDPEADALTLVRRLLTSYTAYIRKHRELARILAEGVVGQDPEIRAEQLTAFTGASTMLAQVIERDVSEGTVRLVTDPETAGLLFVSFTAMIAYAVLLDLDRRSVAGFDPDYALDLFFDLIRE